MVITGTNGVSFSLVDGACCAIKFSSTPGSNGKLYFSSLNINSTGTKNVARYSFSPPYFGSWTYFYPSSTWFVVYANSNYHCVSASFAAYSDAG